MRRAGCSFIVFCLALGCACNRTEEPTAPSGADAATATPAAGGSAASAPTTSTTATPTATSTATPTATAGAGGSTTAACIVPLGAAAPIVGKAVQCPKDPTGNLKLPLGKITFLDAAASPQVDVELARDDASRERGLMYRTSMADNRGMLFSWQNEQVRNFWMHNTCIPLDMLYITREGIIAGILEQVPTLNDAPRGIQCPVAHVLELNAGWARAHGIAPGMKVKIEG